MARSLFLAILILFSMFNLIAPAFADDSPPPAEKGDEKKKEPEVILAPAPPPKPTKAKKKKKAKVEEAAPAGEDPKGEPTVEVAGEHEPVVTLADPAAVDALTPVDGGPRTRSLFAPRLAHTSLGDINFRLGYEYQAWLKPNWALVLPVQIQVVGNTYHGTVQDLRGWVEFGVQHTTSGKVGTLHQQLRLGVWADAFPAQASPSLTYVFDGEVGHRMLDLDGLVSFRPISSEQYVYSEGSAGIWLFREGTFRLAGAWDTELGVGPRVDFNVKTVRFNTTVFFQGDLTLALAATWRM